MFLSGKEFSKIMLFYLVSFIKYWNRSYEKNRFIRGLPYSLNSRIAQQDSSISVAELVLFSIKKNKKWEFSQVKTTKHAYYQSQISIVTTYFLFLKKLNSRNSQHDDHESSCSIENTWKHSSLTNSILLPVLQNPSKSRISIQISLISGAELFSFIQ
jgi:hypothetical protein